MVYRDNAEQGLEYTFLMLCLLTISADFVSLGPQEMKANSLALSCREEHLW